MEIILCLAYLSLLWATDGLLRNSRRRAAAVILLWILTSLSWNVFDTCKTAVVLIFYLLAYIALRLPGSFSVLLAAAVISADAAIWLFTQQSDVNEILMYSIIHAGTYGFFWGARMRREANDYKLTFSDNFSLSTFSSPR